MGGGAVSDRITVFVIDYPVAVKVFIQKVPQLWYAIGCKRVHFLSRGRIDRGVVYHVLYQLQILFCLDNAIDRTNILYVDRIAFLDQVGTTDCPVVSLKFSHLIFDITEIRSD